MNYVHFMFCVLCIINFGFIAVMMWLTEGSTNANFLVSLALFIISCFAVLLADSIHTQEDFRDQVMRLKDVNDTLAETHAHLSEDIGDLETILGNLNAAVGAYRTENEKNETLTILDVFRHLGGPPEFVPDKTFPNKVNICCISLTKLAQNKLFGVEMQPDRKTGRLTEKDWDDLVFDAITGIPFTVDPDTGENETD
eukprot:FR736653.1.p1 GENE.FR736653.1~~FR736653.1.p1  ORF type:complete len:197 (+),score=21.40 FR736653.1:132-722(+)